MQPDQQIPQPYGQVPAGTPPPGYQSFPAPQAASQMKHHHSWGLIISLVVCIILFLGALGFGIWAFSSQQDYKNNSDKKAAAAVQVAIQKEDSKKDAEFTEKEKRPTKTYQGPETFGSLNLSYPKTWSAYVIQNDKASVAIDGYFHPDFVPATNSGTSFALRVEVLNQSYSTLLKQFDGKVKTGKVKVTPYTAKNVSDVTGSRVQGEIETGKQSIMVLLPLRDKTIRISTQAQQFYNDFDNIVLASLKFVP